MTMMNEDCFVICLQSIEQFCSFFFYLRIVPFGRAEGFKSIVDGAPALHESGAQAMLGRIALKNDIFLCVVVCQNGSVREQTFDFIPGSLVLS